MSISFAASVAACVRGARQVVVVAPAKCLAKGGFPKKLLHKSLVDAAVDLATETPAGPRGATAATLMPGRAGPKWLRIVSLPNTLSRYNAPSRADSIRHVLSASDLGRQGKVAVVLVLDEAAHLLPAANAVARALPRFTAKAQPSRIKVQIAAATADGRPVRAADVVKATIAAACDSAELVDTPPSELDPQAFATRARALLKGVGGIKVTEIRGDKLLGKKLRGIHAVGRAAVAEPRMLIVETTAKRKGGLHVALVGKGVTFDTGGLHIKARGMMEGMKADMGGAAAVFGAFRVLATSGCPHRVTLVLCLAENAVDARAYKPDDIIEMHSGRTVEINNTDAEGRLLLGDGVSYAARDLKANVIIDAATLTGAQLISTGTVHAAVVTNDAELETGAIAAGMRSGDLVHPLPFAPELYQAEFKSPVADMRNSVANRMNAQSACAAQFIYAHIQNAPGAARRRWCHIDLAGPAFVKDRGSGYGVALISELVRSL